MCKIIISDTSTLILFHKIEEISILQGVYGEIMTTPEVAEELLHYQEKDIFGFVIQNKRGYII